MIDITPILDPALQALGIALGALLVWAAQRLIKKMNLDIDLDNQAIVDFVANKGVALARQKITGPDGRVTANVKSQVVADAATYLIDKAPSALGHFGIDPGTPDGARKIRELVEARLPADSDPDPQ